MQRTKTHRPGTSVSFGNFCSGRKNCAKPLHTLHRQRWRENQEQRGRGSRKGRPPRETEKRGYKTEKSPPPTSHTLHAPSKALVGGERSTRGRETPPRPQGVSEKWGDANKAARTHQCIRERRGKCGEFKPREGVGRVERGRYRSKGNAQKRTVDRFPEKVQKSTMRV